MERYRIFNGYLFGIDDERANRLRFALPFESAGKFDYIELVEAGAITGLFDAGDDLGIECGSSIFYLSGRGPASFALRKRVGPER